MHSFSLRLADIAHQVQCFHSCPDHTFTLIPQFLKLFLLLALGTLFSGFSSFLLRCSFSLCYSSSLYLSCWHILALTLVQGPLLFSISLPLQIITLSRPVLELDGSQVHLSSHDSSMELRLIYPLTTSLPTGCVRGIPILMCPR